MACLEPLPLMRMIYRSLPYITNLGASNRLESNASLDDVFALDHLYRDIFWGCSIVIATVFLMILTCVYCCCTCCVCCMGDCLDRKKPTGLKIGCGLINTFFVVIGLAFIGASLWAEVMLDRSLQRAVPDTSNSSLNIGLSFFINAEAIWHWVVIGYLVILAIFLLVVLLSFVTSPLCKNPAAILILLVFLAVFTLMTSVMAGAVFFFLIFLGDTCIAISNLTGNLPGGCLIQDPNSFCNDVYYHGFIFCILGCGLVVTFILIQIFAPLYASTLTGIEEEEQKQKPMVAFQNDGGVWNAYGTQQVLGVTSQAQPVSEDVVLSEVEPPQYNDVVTNMQEV